MSILNIYAQISLSEQLEKESESNNNTSRDRAAVTPVEIFMINGWIFLKTKQYAAANFFYFCRNSNPKVALSTRNVKYWENATTFGT